jgi:hypothetical protein
MMNFFPIYEEMCKYLTIYEQAVSRISLCNRSRLSFLIYEENFIFFFISVAGCKHHGAAEVNLTARVGQELEAERNRRRTPLSS